MTTHRQCGVPVCLLAIAMLVGCARTSAPPSRPPSNARDNAPALRVIESKAGETDGIQHREYLLRNTGGAGEILVVLQQSPLSWKYIVHFDAGAERKVTFRTPGALPGNVMAEFIPANAASPVQLEGAVAL